MDKTLIERIVPTDETLVERIVPADRTLLLGTVPADKMLFGGTLGKKFLIDTTGANKNVLKCIPGGKSIFK